jgi:hypothetical protein
LPDDRDELVFEGVVCRIKRDVTILEQVLVDGRTFVQDARTNPHRVPVFLGLTYVREIPVSTVRKHKLRRRNLWKLNFENIA